MTIPAEPVPLTPSLAAALRRAVAAEREATGSRRRGAFRTTRVLLGALQVGGFDVHHMAELIGVNVENVRGRAQKGGLLLAASAAHVAGLTESELATLIRKAQASPLPGPAYRADDVVAVLRQRDMNA